MEPKEKLEQLKAQLEEKIKNLNGLVSQLRALEKEIVEIQGAIKAFEELNN